MWRARRDTRDGTRTATGDDIDADADAGIEIIELALADVKLEIELFDADPVPFALLLTVAKRIHAKKAGQFEQIFRFCFLFFSQHEKYSFFWTNGLWKVTTRTVLPNRLKVIVVEAPAAMAVFNDVKLLYIAAVSTDAAAEDDANAVDVTDVLEHLFLVFGSFSGRFRL